METLLKDIIKHTIKEYYNIEVNEIKLDVPPKKDLGDFAFGPFMLAKDLKKNPNEISIELAKLLSENEDIIKAETAGPYINITLSKDIFTKKFNTYISKDFLGELSKNGNGESIVVDYIGANVGKPLHIGHMCTPNVGQSMINIYKRLGYNVISDSHIGDWGIIFGKLILAFKMWGDKEELKKDAVNYLFDLYVKISTYIEETGIEGEQKARDEFKLLSEGDKESIELWKEFTSYSIDGLRKELARLNVEPDFDIGESFYEGLGLPKLQNYPDLKDDMSSIVEELIEKGIATKNDDNSVGVIFSDESKLPSVILQKRDGTHGYLASDLACIKYRMQNWNPKEITYFVDVRQQLHFKQAFEIARLAGWIPNTQLTHAYNGFISLKDGAMSTRKGRIVKLEDLLDESQKRAKEIILEKRQDIKGEELEDISKIIGIGAIKYGYLKKSRETDVVFDWDEFMSFEGNSGPYIQYSYVRAIRILENFNEDIDFEVKAIFTEQEETDLVKLLLDYEKTLLETYSKNMPHILCKYIYDLTKSFSSFYNNIHILNENDYDKKILRLKLVKLYSEILKDSFGLLGIEMPNKM